MITSKLILFLLICECFHVEQANLINVNSVMNGGSAASMYSSARIQCEYRDKDGDSLVLNCTLVSGSNLGTLNSQDSSVIAGVLVNSLDTNFLSGNGASLPGVSSSASSSSLSNMNIRVGVDRLWRTPWESLSINHNIIRTLIWRNSRLSEIGNYAFKDLNSIERLDLSYNRLYQLNSTSLANLEVDLIDLDLSHNIFQQIPVELFENNKRLQSVESIRMNENPIVAITRRPFELLKNSLRIIELNYCQIRHIELNAFEAMSQLESVSLIGNHLRHLNQLTFADLSLRSFYVHENPLVCDCHMRWLIDYLKAVDYQQQTYESQLSVMPSTTRRYQQFKQQQPFSSLSMSVAAAAQQSLKCDQPNSLKSKPNFLDINPDSFMCDIQLHFRDSVNESTYEMGDDAVLVCDVYGDPEPEIYWSFGQKPIEKALTNEMDKYYVNEIRPSSYSGRYQPGLQHVTNKTSELRIRDLQPSDVGYYTCTAEIKGSNNRKHIVYNVKQVRGGPSSLSNAGDLFLNGLNSFVNRLFNFVYSKNVLAMNRPDMYYSNSTLLLLFSILISIFLFLLIFIMFLCWKMKCLCCRRAGQKTRVSKSDKLLSIDDLMLKKEQEKLLSNGATLRNGSAKLIDRDYADQVDTHHHHHHQNYANLANDSSATLTSTNKMSNSIRMAYPNYAMHHQQLNEIYANHSLLTTTSSTTGGSFPTAAPPTIAIDTSNHTPRYLFLQQQSQDCYYDDLRYTNGDEQTHNGVLSPANIYSSPYRQHHHHTHKSGQQSYSPIIRRDDPTIPLYATLKPKMMIQQQIQVNNKSYLGGGGGNYSQYTTIQNRSSYSQAAVAPSTKPRNTNVNYQQLHLPLPPPPPPPPPIPPIKPKRTFEYVLGVNRELHSESGAFLLSAEENASNNTNTTPSIDHDPNNELDYQTYHHHHQPVVKASKQHRPLAVVKSTKVKNQQAREGSTTSLDEEDLDLNDLKDFEDVTFDNLRKPGEHDEKTDVKPQPKPQTTTTTTKFSKKVVTDIKETNSEQSLLLKSSSSSDKSSSDNTINNLCTGNSNSNSNTSTTNTNSNTNCDIPMSGLTMAKSPSESARLLIDQNKLENNLMENVVEFNSKIYEETEI